MVCPSRYKMSFYNATSNTPIKKIIMETTSSYSNLSPVYYMELDVDTRKIFYYGKNNVKKIGTHRGILSGYSVELIVEMFQNSYFFKLGTGYVANLPDLSFTKITVYLKDGTHKSVLFDQFAKPVMLLVIKIVLEHEMHNIVWLD